MLKKSPKMLALPQKAYAAIPVIALALVPGAAFAQQAQDDGIVVTARLDDPAQGATGGVRLLFREDIEAQAPVTLLENFALLPGIDAFEKGGAGGGSYLAIRGGEPNFTLVTINGVRVNDPLLSSGGGFDFTLLGTATQRGSMFCLALPRPYTAPTRCRAWSASASTRRATSPALRRGWGLDRADGSRLAGAHSFRARRVRSSWPAARATPATSSRERPARVSPR